MTHEINLIVAIGISTDKRHGDKTKKRETDSIFGENQLPTRKLFAWVVKIFLAMDSWSSVRVHLQTVPTSLNLFSNYAVGRREEHNIQRIYKRLVGKRFKVMHVDKLKTTNTTSKTKQLFAKMKKYNSILDSHAKAWPNKKKFNCKRTNEAFIENRFLDFAISTFPEKNTENRF